MVDAVKELGTPPLRPQWVAAKKKAEEAAGKLKQDKLYDALEKKFKTDLGPDLEAWPKLYPNFAKLTAEHGTILATIKSYTDAVKAAGLDAKVAKLMTDALLEIKGEMDKRLKKAELLVMSDESLAIKESKKKQATPIIIFNLDVADQVRSKSGDAAKVLKVDTVKLEVVLTDPEVLKNVPNDLDDAVLAKEIREAASFARVVQDIATALGKAAKLVKRGQADLEPAQKAFEEGVEEAVNAALVRAAEPILKYTKIKTNNRNFKIKTGATITLTALGAASGVVALALTPLTFGVSSVAGAIGLAKAGVALGKQIADLAASAEEVAVGLGKDIATLGKQYENAKKTLVGAGELGKTLVNATMPALITTISSAKGDCDLLGSKIDLLVGKTHDKASELGAMLTEQTKIQKALAEVEKVSKQALTDAEAKAFEKLMALFDKSAESVTQQIDKVNTLNTRVKRTSADHKKLSTALGGIAAKEPTWAQIGEVVINVAAGVGFMVAGSVNAPDPYQFAKLANDINGAAGNALASLDTLKTGLEGLKGVIEKRAKG